VYVLPPKFRPSGISIGMASMLWMRMAIPRTGSIR
jgi:hypothetical protein